MYVCIYIYIYTHTQPKASLVLGKHLGVQNWLCFVVGVCLEINISEQRTISVMPFCCLCAFRLGVQSLLRPVRITKQTLDEGGYSLQGGAVGGGCSGWG